jgi:hypothetical protein
MHSWTETAAAMGAKKVMAAAKKGPRKRIHTDPYAGGQGSGKQAQPDARVAKKPRLSESVASTSQGELSVATPDLPSEDAETPLTPDDFHAPEEEQGSAEARSPEELLLEALTLYNEMFPPSKLLDESQPVVAAPRTSYYREHLYN